MTKTTVRKTNGKIKRTIASMLAAVMVMTTAATIAASADTTQAVVHMNTCAAMRNESELDTTIHIPFGMDIDVIDTARNLTEKTLDKIIDHFAPCDIVKDILNKGAAYFLNWAFPGEEKEKEPTITDVIDKIDVVEEKLKSYHNEEMSKLKALGSKIDSEPFRNQIDQVSSDTRKVINALKAHKCNITTTDDGVIDTTTYKTYRTILGESCKFDVMMTHLMDMEGFVLGYKYGTDKQEGFGLYSKYLVDCVNDRSIDYDFEKAPDFNIVRDCINGELQSMEAMCVLDTLCLMTLNNMRYKIRQYEIENGKYHVESNEKPFSSFENEADEIADYLRNISAKYKATVEHNNKTVVGAELTIDGETKGFATFTEAWATVTIENCTFRGNRAKSVASAIWGGGAATIRNCRFENNISATKIDCQKDAVICTSQVKQVNCTFVGNSHVDKIPELDYAAEIAREKREAEGVLRKQQEEAAEKARQAELRKMTTLEADFTADGDTLTVTIKGLVNRENANKLFAQLRNRSYDCKKIRLDVKDTFAASVNIVNFFKYYGAHDFFMGVMNLFEKELSGQSFVLNGVATLQGGGELVRK